MFPDKDLEELIRAAQGGDTDAFDELARLQRDRIFWIARQVVGNSEDAKDVAQNVLIRLWRVLPKYDSRYAFSTWIYRMTVNLAIDYIRRASPRARDTSLDDTLVQFASTSGGPAEAASEREVEKIFDELRELLPPRQRAVFALREIQGLSSAEVAEILGLSSSTVRNHLFQARRTLRKELARRHPEYLPPSRSGETGGDEK